MKKLLFISFMNFIFGFSSCTESVNYADPNLLNGTTWRCIELPISSWEGVEYIELRFISTTEIEFWEKVASASSANNEGLGTYSINDKDIQIKIGDVTTIGNIVKNKITLLNTGNSGTETLVFTKQ